VRVEGEWRVMTCPNCGQEYRERAPRQRDHNPGKDRERVERSKGKTR
jgi:rubredoxin